MVLAVALIFITGCATQQFSIGRKGPVRRQPDEERWQHFFVYQLVPTSQSIDATAVCGRDGVAYVETEKTFLNGLSEVATIGIYNPRTARIWCRGPGAVSPRNAPRNSPPRRQRNNRF